MKYTSGIYRITNLIDGKIYIGSAIRVEKRWNDHRRDLRDSKHHSPYLQRAFDKHGHDAFAFEIMEVVLDRSMLLAREQHWLDATRAYDPIIGYNLCKIAGNTAGRTHSAETRQKIADKAVGRKLSPEHRAKISAGNRGKFVSEETRQKQSDALKGRYVPAEHMQRMSEICRGQKRTIESRLKQGAALKGKPRPDHVKAKIAATQTGKMHSPETIAKLKLLAQERAAKKRAAKEAIQVALPI